MFEELACTCSGCDRELADASLQLVYRLGNSERRAYECACGAMTITLANSTETTR